MSEPLSEFLSIGGKSNSLGKVNEVIEITLRDPTRLDELYSCMFYDDAWVRMRAADAFEKICRVKPEWIVPYIDKIQDKLVSSTQASIQWHIAQIYKQVPLSSQQEQRALDWLSQRVSTTDVDWIVAANSMDTLAHFAQKGSFPRKQLITLLHTQKHHASKSVVRRAEKLLYQVSLPD